MEVESGWISVETRRVNAWRVENIGVDDGGRLRSRRRVEDRGEDGSWVEQR